VGSMETGPIDYLIVEWGAGYQPDGSALVHLVDLVDRGIIRVLDLVFITKSENGAVGAVAIEQFDLDATPELALFVGASSGLVGEEDVVEAGAAIEPGRSAAILVYENSWAAPFASALRDTGAQLVATGRIPINAIEAALDALEASD
jgi:Family of unknown function (DUF6325)